MKALTWLLIAIGAASLSAQTITTGEITGVVRDPTGAVVTTATILLKSVDTGETRTAPSNASGLYRFTFVRPGNYEISSSSAGLKSDVGRLVAAVGQVQVLDLHLKLTGIREVELVTDAAPLLDKDNANATYAVSTRQLELLPLPGGDLAAVAYSAPGVVINTNQTYGSFALQGVGSTSNLFTFNGVESMEPYYNVNNSGVSGLLLGANEIQEAAIVQNAYDGQYGRQAGAQVNYVTKSGGNAYHGNAAYSYNGDWMNANDFFGNSTGTPRPHGVSNQYAAAMGGRVIRDRLFFFADTEGLRFAQPGYTSVVTIPSPAFESYSLRTIQLAQTALYQEMFDLYKAAPGHERAVAVTNGNGPLQDSSNRLGCGKLAGTATGAGGVFGSDVSCAQTWGTNIPTQTSEWLLSARADYNVNSRQRIFFRFRTDHGLMPTSSAINPAFGPSISFPDYEGQVNHTYVITPHMVNNFIGSGTYNDYVYSVADLSAALKLFPFRFNILDGRGFTALGASSSYPSGRRAGQLQVVDDVAYSFGRHWLKAGVNYRGNRESDLQYSALAYIPRVTFRSLKDLAAGVLNPQGSSGDLYTQAFALTPKMHLRLYTLGLYFEDHWAVTQKLKLTATLRFDRTGNPYCADHCFSRLVEPFPVLSKGLSIPYDQSIQAGLAYAYYHVEPILPQPRLGLAYSPAWSTGTVFRGGIGVFMDLYPAYFAGKMGGNPPNVFTSLIYSGTVNTGGDGSASALALASANAFENQFANGATLAQLQQAVSQFGPPSYSSVPSTLRSPKFVEWSFEIDRQLGTRSVLTLRYAGNYGYDIFLTSPNVNAYANPAIYPNGFGGLPAAAPDPRFQTVSQITNAGYSKYHGLTATFRRALGRGFAGQLNYTWSHALDTVSNGGLTAFSENFGQIDPYNSRSLNYASADYDVRQQVTGEFIWDLPVRFKKGLMAAILSGWSAGGTVNAHTGTPFSVMNSGAGSFGFAILADVLDPNVRTACGASAIHTPCLTASQFAGANAQNDFGNRPRNPFRGPGFFDLDSSLYKTVTFGERMRFTFGASAYNLLNHPNFGIPNNDVSGSSFGLIGYAVSSPSSPYGSLGGLSGRTLVVSGRFAF